MLGHRTFSDRIDAGNKLSAAILKKYPNISTENPIVFALPRGGIPVAYPLARSIGADLDVILVRKIGCPDNSELAMGAIASVGGEVVTHWNTSIKSLYSKSDAESAWRKQQVEIARRNQLYRQNKPLKSLTGYNRILVVDDGIATGATVHAALLALHQSAVPGTKITLATPVASESTLRKLAGMVTDIVCLEVPRAFYAVGQVYDDFTQVSDQEVVDCLAEFAHTETAST